MATEKKFSAKDKEYNEKTLKIIKDIMEKRKEGVVAVSVIDGDKIKTTSFVNGYIMEHINALDLHFKTRMKNKGKRINVDLCS